MKGIRIKDGDKEPVCDRCKQRTKTPVQGADIGPKFKGKIFGETCADAVKAGTPLARGKKPTAVVVAGTPAPTTS